MLSQAINELTIDLLLTAESPVLIKEGRFGKTQRDDWSLEAMRDKEPSLAKGTDEWTRELNKVRQRMPNGIPISHASIDKIRTAMLMNTAEAISHAVSGFPFYLPGSSLRGAWRAHLERSLRSLDPPGAPRVCDPLLSRSRAEDEPYDESCSSRLEIQRKNILDNRVPSLPPYRVSCPICRLFGNTVQASRLSISDAEREFVGAIEGRHHVRIDRRTGRADETFGFFGLKNYQFKTNLRLRNFELWQVRLLFELLGALTFSKVLVGSGKSKGYGVLKGVWNGGLLTWFGKKPADGLLRGIAEHPEWGAQISERYGLHPAANVPDLHGQWTSPEPWRHEMKLSIDMFAPAAKSLSRDWENVPPLTARQLAREA
jgi:CRISPR/Cas system CSM-associated protein Csm3 (group 7 of RAMP superfamily)